MKDTGYRTRITPIRTRTITCSASLAFLDALKDWPDRDLSGVEVKLVGDFSKNPGGVSQYHVQLVG